MANIKPKKYNKVLTLKLDDETLNKIDFVAEQTNTKRSEVIRNFINQREIKITKKNGVNKYQKEYQKKLLYELNKIGNNINQIAYVLNIANNENLLDDIDYKNILEQLQMLNIQMKETLNNGGEK